MNDDDVEARLARWKPARPASELMRRLHASVPPAQVELRPMRRAGKRFGSWSQRPLPLAYAGLLAAWTLILALRLLTPSDPEPTPPAATAQTDAVPNDAPTFAGTLAAERTFLLTRKNLDQL